MIRSFLLFAAFAVAAPVMAQTAESPDTQIQAEPQERAVRIVEDVPRLVMPRRVLATDTPSGLPVPRYVSLKFSKTNGRTGPSRNHGVAWQYKRRGLPVIVVAETEQWRRVRDINGDESWVKSTGLSGERRVLVTDPLDVMAKPSASARTRARTENGALLELGGCREGWCEVRGLGEQGGIKGWALQSRLWGSAPL